MERINNYNEDGTMKSGFENYFFINPKHSLKKEGNLPDYCDIANCPFAVAFRETYPQYKKVFVTTSNVLSEGSVVARLKKPFRYSDYEKVIEGETFTTKIEFL